MSGAREAELPVSGAAMDETVTRRRWFRRRPGWLLAPLLALAGMAV